MIWPWPWVRSSGTRALFALQTFTPCAMPCEVQATIRGLREEGVQPAEVRFFFTPEPPSFWYKDLGAPTLWSVDRRPATRHPSFQGLLRDKLGRGGGYWIYWV
eukprot:scaffold215375_cov37-Tisochrysis_lutea.AAC.3